MEEGIPFNASTLIIHLLSGFLAGIGFIGTAGVVLGVLLNVIVFEVWQLAFPVMLVIGVFVVSLNMASIFGDFFGETGL